MVYILLPLVYNCVILYSTIFLQGLKCGFYWWEEGLKLIVNIACLQTVFLVIFNFELQGPYRTEWGCIVPMLFYMNYYVVYILLSFKYDLWFSHTVLWSDSLQHQLYGVYGIGFMQIGCLVIETTFIIYWYRGVLY